MNEIPFTGYLLQALNCGVKVVQYLIWMDGPGTITWEEFFENAKSFARVSDEIFDSWELRGDKVQVDR